MYDSRKQMLIGDKTILASHNEREIDGCELCDAERGRMPASSDARPCVVLMATLVVDVKAH